ncbi:MAG TPA: sigma 54-interacting transcriptional regulator [Kofleriaceae bacterium]|nr:sigma 54-interacting transcriptional regulator [Kofleriaceae bacterium]
MTSGVRTVLTLVVSAYDLSLAPARHRIDDLDAVVFLRGPRRAERDDRDGLRRLTLQLPDPFLSKQHGRLLWAKQRWMIESPLSKNGVVMNGQATRYAAVAIGDVIEIGHCVFLIERLTAPEDAPLDQLLGSAAPGPSPLPSLHPELLAAAAVLPRVARSAIPVLLHGETGTGKEVYARALHDASGRTGAFVAVNCGALSPSLLEAELFGHRKGAFSGATSDRPGFVRASDGGTLFLDEIASLSEAGQVALLRVLQENEVIAVGDTRAVPVDLRVCAASQLPLVAEVEAGRFRSDLYARLLGYELALPPLRERRGDLGYLVGALLRRLSARPVELTPAAARCVIEYDWPRNVRELERCLAAALVLADGHPIDTSHLPAAVTAHHRVPTNRHAPMPTEGDPDHAAIRLRLAAKLTEHRGNVSAVARDLRMHRTQIQRLIHRFGFDIDRFRGAGG